VFRSKWSTPKDYCIFLNCRSQSVVVNGILSKSLSVTSGVPQWRVLGPIIFIIYINDLSSVFPKTIVSKYFADDAKLYTEIKCGEDIDELQLGIDRLTDWANSWQLSISIKKCCTMDMTIDKRGGSFL